MKTKFEIKTKMKKQMINLLFIILISHLSSSTSQQLYEKSNPQLLCDVAGVSTSGYTCNLTNSDPQNCNSFIVFRSQTNYQTPLQISNLLNSNPSSISKLNESPTNNSTIPINDLVLIPTTCNCSNGFYQHNASYVVHIQGETYLTIANYTYQGLTACQAMMKQNKIKEREIFAGNKLLVPLRCACPTKNQTKLGFKFLLTYIITWKDTVSGISQMFGANFRSVLDANGLSDTDIINPFTTLLIPLKKEPTKVQTSSPPLSAPGPSTPAADTPPPAGGGASSKKWVALGVAIGAVFVVLLALAAAWYFCCFKRARAREMHDVLPTNVRRNKTEGNSSDLSSFMSSEVRNFMESLTVYKFSELEKATNYFGEESRIQGSVFQAVINKDKAAIKRLKGDVSNEIKILKQINHSSIIRLSGFCIHEGDTYLVYEFLEKGSLADWIHVKKDLTWKQRVIVAYDVADGLNYLHNYTNPPYIHKNLKSSNILLDSEFRGKIANFGLARSFEENEGYMHKMTSHVVGTQGYMAPEYLEHGLITAKLDVFAFGVVVLEILSGKEAVYVKDGEDKVLMLWEEMGKVMKGEDKREGLKGFMDPGLGNEYPLDLAFAMAELAGGCVGKEAGSRPAMAEVFMSLSAIYNSTLEWDPSLDVGSSRSMVHGR